MKLSLITTLLFFVTTLSYAQSMIGDGNRMIGGGIAFGSNEREDINFRNYFSSNWDGRIMQNIKSETSNFSLNPYYGKFYNDDALIGFGFNYSMRSHAISRIDSLYERNNEFDNKSFGFYVFTKRYIAVSNKFGIYVAPNISYSRSSEDDLIENIDYKSGTNTYIDERRNIMNTGSMNIALGLYFFIFDQLSIETSLLSASISFSKEKWNFVDSYNSEEYEGSNNSNNIHLNFANSFTFNKLFVLNYFF